MGALQRNLITVTHSVGEDPVEIHHGIAVTHAHPRHWHDEYLVCAITGGAGYTVYGGRAYFTPPGSMFLLPPGEVHSNHATADGCSYTNIYLPASRVRNCLAPLDTRCAELPALVAEDPGVHRAFLSLCRDLEYEFGRLQRDTSYLHFFHLLLTRLAPNREPRRSPEPKAVRVVREFLDAHFDQDVSLEHLAQLAGLSPYHLNRTFREQLGIPPHAYVIQLRITRAKLLLRSGLPIAEVAHATGFADQSHFTRHFKKMVGITPGQFIPYRKNVQSFGVAAD